jgi:hypothetical protein
MAGTSVPQTIGPDMADYLVDVVKAARRLDGPEAAPAAPAQPGSAECPLGHANAAGTRFCGECGLPLGSVDLGPRVDLEAVREAVQRPLTAQEQAARDREHAQVLAANLAAEQQVRDVTQIADPSEKTIMVHFVEDGFTWGGKVWQVGEMLQIGPKHPKWESALTWIRLSKAEQYARYGRIFFDFGPWPGAAPPPGAEIPLSTAAASRWSRGVSVPAHAAGDGSQSLVPW